MNCAVCVPLLLAANCSGELSPADHTEFLCKRNPVMIKSNHKTIRMMVSQQNDACPDQERICPQAPSPFR